MDKEKITEKQVKVSTIAYSLIVVVLFMVACLAAVIYFFNYRNPSIEKAEKIIPFPAAIVNNSQFVTIAQVNENTKSVKNFYENQDFSQIGMRVDFNTEDGKKRLKIKEKEVLNKLIENKQIEILAQKNGISINSKTVDENVKRKLEEYQGEEETAEQKIEKLYGWNLNDFKQKIVKPDMLADELKKIFESQDKTRDEAREAIAKAKKELDKEKNFSDVAKRFSKGATADMGGELGWFSKEQLIPELAAESFELEINKPSSIIESTLGFHIILVSDKKSENETDLVKLSQIFYPKKTFGEWLKEQTRDMEVRILLKDYYWDDQNSSVEFSSAELKEFEKKSQESFQGDASI